MALTDWLRRIFRRRRVVADTARRRRGPATHIIILDGTMSSLDDGSETNAGLTYKLLAEAGQRVNLTLHYEAGVQWRDWSETYDVMTGRGINRTIRRAYGVLASRYRPGDRIILMGYSRGAFAARSLAGAIGMVGLLRAEHATVSNIRTCYRHYIAGAESEASAAFRNGYCHADIEIEAVAIWDTVKALGLRLPVLWRLSEPRHGFHNARLGGHVRNGFHALALDERREAYSPVLWECPDDYDGHMEQVWFRGNHGDVGGQLSGIEAARPLANIPLVWMLERLEMCGVPLPDGWSARFQQDVNAPSIGQWHGWAKLFLLRKARVVGRDKSERLHGSVAGARLDEIGDLAGQGTGPSA